MKKKSTGFPGIQNTFDFWSVGSVVPQGKSLHARLDVYDKNGTYTNNNTRYILKQLHSQLAQLVQAAEK